MLRLHLQLGAEAGSVQRPPGVRPLWVRVVRVMRTRALPGHGLLLRKQWTKRKRLLVLMVAVLEGKRTGSIRPHLRPLRPRRLLLLLGQWGCLPLRQLWL